MIASFPGRLHCQYLITCKISGGKAWDIGSHVMTSGRQMVDTQGEVSNLFRVDPSLALRTTNSIDRLPCKHSGQYKTGCQDSSLGTTFSVSISQPDGTARDQISQAFPHHIGSDEILAVGTAWERGYVNV